MFPLRKSIVLLILVIIFVNAGCSDTPASPQTAEPDWPSSIPEEQGVDSDKLELMMDVIQELGLPVKSVVVIRHGHLVFEEYPDPDFGPADMQRLYSATKSFTSALIGIAIQKGFIESVEQKVLDFFPEWTFKNLDSRKEELTIENLLTMSCGFEWEGPDDDFHTWGDAIHSGDPVRYVLDLPMVSDPGTEWVYNGGCSHILSAILTKTTGLSTLDFARKYLFSPLGITKVKWPRDPQGIYYGGQDLWLRPRDMAKFGQLFLNNGMWEGQQVIPADWVNRSAETFLTHDRGGYGYQWWTLPMSRIYYASGSLGQRIYVIPDLDMVVAFTADNKASGLKEGEIRTDLPMVAWLLGRYILPACDTYAGYQYDEFGFSFEIPLGMHAQTVGKSFQGTASETSGIVHVQYDGSPLSLVGVQWDSIAPPLDMQNSLKDFPAVLESLGPQVNASGEFSSTTRGGHELVYEPIDVTAGVFSFPGFIGAWYCEESERVYIFYYANIHELAMQIDTLSEFQGYVDSFTCNP